MLHLQQYPLELYWSLFIVIKVGCIGGDTQRSTSVNNQVKGHTIVSSNATGPHNQSTLHGNINRHHRANSKIRNCIDTLKQTCLLSRVKNYILGTAIIIVIYLRLWGSPSLMGQGIATGGPESRLEQGGLLGSMLAVAVVCTQGGNSSLHATLTPFWQIGSSIGKE